MSDLEPPWFHDPDFLWWLAGWLLISTGLVGTFIASLYASF